MILLEWSDTRLQWLTETGIRELDFPRILVLPKPRRVGADFQTGQLPVREMRRTSRGVNDSRAVQWRRHCVRVGNATSLDLQSRSDLYSTDLNKN